MTNKQKSAFRIIRNNKKQKSANIIIVSNKIKQNGL